MKKKIWCRRLKYIFMNRFLFAAWNIRFAFGAARLVVSKSEETKWRFEKLRRLRWQRVSSDVWEIVFVAFWRKTCCSCRNLNFRVTMVFVRLGERRALSPLRWPRSEMGARCRERDYASDWHSKFWGDIKLCLCETCWMHLIYIQLGFLARNP